MENTLFLVILLLFLLFIGSKKSTKKTTSRASSKKAAPKSVSGVLNADESAEDIAERITTLKQFWALNDKMEKTCDKIYTLKSDSAADKAEAQYRILEEAIAILTFNVITDNFLTHPPTKR